MKNNYIRGYDKWKRLIDCCFASAGLIVLSPVFMIIMMMLKIETPAGKTIFKQKRIGQNGREFYIYKFRSLSEEAPESAPSKVIKAERFTTKFGRIMRKTGLDELPQLINVAMGDMSIVGPRPLIPEEGEIHNSRMKKGIYTLRPGITGLAQIHGGNSISDGEKLSWDYKYLVNRSLIMDFNICVKTFLISITGRITPHKVAYDKVPDNTNPSLSDDDSPNIRETVRDL